MSVEIDHAICPYCGDAVDYAWENGFISQRHNVLIADCVYHACCWEELVAKYPPRATAAADDDDLCL
jgi:transposase